MATGADVMKLLRPNQGWSIVGEDFLSIKYDDGVLPLTEEEFNAGFAQADIEIETKEIKATAAKEALLSKLGITADEAKLLLS